MICPRCHKEACGCPWEMKLLADVMQFDPLMDELAGKTDVEIADFLDQTVETLNPSNDPHKRLQQLLDEAQTRLRRAAGGPVALCPGCNWPAFMRHKDVDGKDLREQFDCQVPDQ